MNNSIKLFGASLMFLYSSFILRAQLSIPCDSTVEFKAQFLVPCDSTKRNYSQRGIIFTDSYNKKINFLREYKRYTPTISDVLQAEKILFLKYNETLSNDSRVLNFQKVNDVQKKYFDYARQYFGFLDSNNHKIVLIHLINSNVAEEYKSRIYKNFTKRLILGAGDFFELNTFTLFANIDDNNLHI